MIEACNGPGTSVAGVALANGVNANQLRRWMRERGIEPPVNGHEPFAYLKDLLTRLPTQPQSRIGEFCRIAGGGLT